MYGLASGNDPFCFITSGCKREKPKLDGRKKTLALVMLNYRSFSDNSIPKKINTREMLDSEH